MTKDEKIEKIREGMNILAVKNPEYSSNTIDIIKFLHTHVELCKDEEIVYREEDVLILINEFYNKGFTDGIKVF